MANQHSQNDNVLMATSPIQQQHLEAATSRQSSLMKLQSIDHGSYATAAPDLATVRSPQTEVNDGPFCPVHLPLHDYRRPRRRYVREESASCAIPLILHICEWDPHKLLTWQTSRKICKFILTEYFWIY